MVRANQRASPDAKEAEISSLSTGEEQHVRAAWEGIDGGLIWKPATLSL